MFKTHNHPHSNTTLRLVLLIVFCFLLSPLLVARAEGNLSQSQTDAQQQNDADYTHSADKQLQLSAALAPDREILASDASSVPARPEIVTNLPSMRIDEIFADLAARTAQNSEVNAANSPDAVHVDCSEAGLDASLAQGGNIVFNCATPTQITLTSSKEILYNSTIDGGGKVVLSGGTFLRHFVVRNGVTLTLQNIALIEGYADYGGAVFLNARAGLIVKNSIINKNVSAVKGGSFYLRDNTELRIMDSEISHNFSDGAGGVLSTEKLVNIQISNSTFTSNTAVNQGGVIDTYEGVEAYISTSEFRGNASQTYVGGVIDTGSMKLLEISNSQFVGNSSLGWDSSYGFAGAVISGSPKTLRLSSVILKQNHSEYGSGSAIAAGSSNITLTDVSVDSNSPVAIYLDSSTLSIDRSEFANNSGEEGGALKLENGTTVITNSSFLKNHASFQGGAISSYKTDIAIQNSTFDGNKAKSGGALELSGSGYGKDARLENVTLSNNQAEESGGAIYSSPDLYVVDSSLSNNIAGTSGGAILCWDCSFQHVNISQNKAGSLGGAIHCNNCDLINSTIHSNIASSVGGGIYCEDQCQVESTTLQQNSAKNGGALGSDDRETFSYSTSIKLLNTTISDNQSSEQGGAIYLYSDYYDDQVTLRFSTIYLNQAITGTALYGNKVVFDSTNTLIFNPGGVENCSGRGSFTSHHTFANDASCNLTGTGDRQDIGDPKLSALNLYGGTTSVHMPLTGSPLIDAGECQSDILTDQRQSPRPGIAGGNCDIGAVERGPSDKDTPLPKIFLPLISR